MNSHMMKHTHTPPPTSEADLMLSSLLKSNPALLLNPALLSLNPSLYAVQLAQLQLLTQQGGTGTAASEAMRKLSELGGGGGGESYSNPLAQVRKRKHEDSMDEFTAAALAAAGVFNPSTSAAAKGSPTSSPRLTESPLDLSGAARKMDSPGGKIPKLGDDKMASALGPWSFLHPLLAAGSLSPEALTRFQMGLPTLTASAMESASAGGLKNPLERMSEIAKGSSAAAAAAAAAAAIVSSSSSAASAGMRLAVANAGSRPSAWQSQWLNRGPESNKDIFKCVWCKESYPSLQSLTTHMKETKHFGGSIPPSPQMPASSPTISRPPIPSMPQTSSSSMMSTMRDRKSVV